MSNPSHSPTPPKRQGRGCAGLFFCLMLVLGSLWGAGLGFFVWVLDDAKSTIAALEMFRPKIGSKVYSDDGELLGEFSIEERQLIRLGEMPVHLQKAFVATEDDTFYSHKGVRPDAIANSLLYALQTGSTRGGSTITQQVVRGVEDLGVGLERSLERKIREAIVAFQVEREFTKDEILELYLNQVFLGISAHGVEAASRQYFGKSCRYVTLGEAATLAGVTRLPNRQEPIHHFDNAKARRDIVLGQMRENEFITQEEYEAGLKEDLAASVVTPERQAQMRKEGSGVWAPNRFHAPYFVEEIRKFILAQYDQKEVFENGLEVRTTIDMRLQRVAEQALMNALEAFDEKKLAQLTAQGREEEFAPVSGALVCIDNRPGFQGFVRAMVGGRDFDKEKFNTVTQAKRQPGSSVKPFVWAAAIASGLTPSTIVVDAPFERRDGAGKLWRPANFDGKFSGPIPIRQALERSINIVSIKLVEQVGMPLVRSVMQRCGITTPIDDGVGLTIGLGTPEVTVLDHCVAYSTFANGGVRHNPLMITAIKDRDGITRYDYSTYAKREQALDPRVAYVMTHMLEGVCRPDGRLRYYPTGHRASQLERPVAGKTGTTNSSRDTWFCGFTTDYTCVVWIGYRDNRSLGRGADYTGGRLACPIWVEFMLAAEEGLPKRDFEVPYGITFYNINRLTGTLGGGYQEAFLTGTAPPAAWTYEEPPALEEVDTQLLEEF